MTNDERAAIVAALKQGHSQVRVAADVAVTIYQVRRVAVEEGLTPRGTSAFAPGDVIACSLERVLTIDDKDHAITNDCLVIARHEKGCGCQR